MRLSDWKGEDAIDLLADLLDPITEILGDEVWNARRKAGATRAELIKLALKGHKREVITILALLNKEDPETYEPSIIDLPVMLMDVLNDEALMELFQSQSQTELLASSGSVTENTEANEH
jgi:hypothetical protein